MNQNSQLRILVREALKELTQKGTPNLFTMIQTVDGYRKVEDMVINYALKNQISIFAAIPLLDNEFETE